MIVRLRRLIRKIKNHIFVEKKYEPVFSKEEEDFFFLREMGVETELGYVKLIGKPIIKKHPNSLIRIEKGVTLVSDVNGNVAGISHPVILSTMAEGAEIIIGKDSGLSGATICARTRVELGEYVGIGVNVSIYDHDFHPLNPYLRKYHNNEHIISKPIKIGDFAWVGGHSIILKGVTIGNGAVLGAGSVLAEDIPELCVYAGNPAKFIKKIEIENEAYNNLFMSGKE